MFYKIFRTINIIIKGIFYEPKKTTFQYPLIKCDDIHPQIYYNQNYLCTLCKNSINPYYNIGNICHKCKYIMKIEN